MVPQDKQVLFKNMCVYYCGQTWGRFDMATAPANFMGRNMNQCLCFNVNIIKLFLSVPFWEADQACSPSRPINASALVCDFCTVLCMFAQDQDDSCGVYVRVERKKRKPCEIRALSRTRLPATSSPGESYIQAEDESVSAVPPLRLTPRGVDSGPDRLVSAAERYSAED